MKIICFPFYHELLQTMHRKDLNIKNKVYIITKSYTRNTCMQQPLAYIFQTLFQHELSIITPTLNAGSRCTGSNYYTVSYVSA